MLRSFARLLVVCAVLAACGPRDDPAQRHDDETAVPVPTAGAAEAPTDVWAQARMSDLSGRYVWYDPSADDDDPPEAGVRSAAIFGAPSSDDTAVSLACRNDGSIRLGGAWLYNGRGGANMEMQVRAGHATETISTTLDGGNEMDPSPYLSITIASRGVIEAMRSADTLTVIGREVGASEWAGFRVRLNEEAFRRFASDC